MNNSEVIADFGRRWTGTYVWMQMDRPSQKEVLVRITAVEEHPKKIATINVASAEYGNMMINFGSDTSSLKFKYPPVGVFQYKEDSAVFYRQPRRQWRRGICADNSSMLFTHRYISGRTCVFDLDSVQAAFTHKTYGLDEALKMLNTGVARSVALKDEFSLCLCPTMESTDYVLLHWLEPVAWVSPLSGKIVKLINSSYKKLSERLYDNLK